MTDPEAARTLLAEALAEWTAGRHYEAHELLEDVAEAAGDDDFEVAMALVHVAAAFHKYVHDVGAQAVPGKIAGALARLDGAPPVWMGIDLATFTAELAAVLAELEAGGRPARLPIPSAPGSSSRRTTDP